METARRRRRHSDRVLPGGEVRHAEGQLDTVRTVAGNRSVSLGTVKNATADGRVALTVGLFTALNVTNLTPDKEYKFRVTAVNAEGESAPLQTEESIIAKNPFGTYATCVSRSSRRNVNTCRSFFQTSRANRATWK